MVQCGFFYYFHCKFEQGKMKRVKIFAVILLIGIVSSGFLYAIWPDDGNSENVVLSGYVHEQPTGKPAVNCSIAIFNCISKDSKVFSESKLFTTTDASGYYEIEIEKSCQMYIRAYKEGYVIARSGIVRAKPETEQNFMLTEGFSKEKDLLKQQEVSEIIQ